MAQDKIKIVRRVTANLSICVETRTSGIFKGKESISIWLGWRRAGTTIQFANISLRSIDAKRPRLEVETPGEDWLKAIAAGDMKAVEKCARRASRKSTRRVIIAGTL
jgi:hypothetical protein